jgi:hypothetical protein
MTADNIRYIVFDVESIPDGKMIKDCFYPKEDISEEVAITLYQKKLLDASNGKTNFIPFNFQKPIIVCIAKVSWNHELIDIVSLDFPNHRVGEMTKLFWMGMEELYKKSMLVSFNGRGFDVPLLETMAFSHGLNLKHHFAPKGRRHRYGDLHMDIQEVVTNFGATKAIGGMNFYSKLLGKPGKIGIDGSDVYPFYKEGRIQEINDYCICDVLDTYFLFLRVKVVQGCITLEREQEIVANAKSFLMEHVEQVPAYKKYLSFWGDWKPVE